MNSSDTKCEYTQQQEQVLTLFANRKVINSVHVKDLFGISKQAARDLCDAWVQQGFFAQAGTGYKLARADKK